MKGGRDWSLVWCTDSVPAEARVRAPFSCSGATREGSWSLDKALLGSLCFALGKQGKSTTADYSQGMRQVLGLREKGPDWSSVSHTLSFCFCSQQVEHLYLTPVHQPSTRSEQDR